jgi:hypothetical protein
MVVLDVRLEMLGEALTHGFSSILGIQNRAAALKKTGA